MTDSGPKFKILKFLKIISASFGVFLLVLFTVASLRTLSLDVNAGLQLARWEKRNNISLVVDHRQREELLANFKGNVGANSRWLLQMWRGRCHRLTTGWLKCVVTCRGRADPHRVVVRAGHQHHRAAGVRRVPPQRSEHVGSTTVALWSRDPPSDVSVVRTRVTRLSWTVVGPKTRRCVITPLVVSPSLPHSFLLQPGPSWTGGRLQPPVLRARITARPDSVPAAGPHRCGACHRVGWLGGPAVLRSGDGRFHLWSWNHRWQGLLDGMSTPPPPPTPCFKPMMQLHTTVDK